MMSLCTRGVSVRSLWFLIGWFFTHHSSSNASRFLSVTYLVGDQAVLPCQWKSVIRNPDQPSPCHIQWRTIAAETVFEQWGAQRWQAEEYRDRVRVPEEGLDTGDCSLMISDVQNDDTGKYESFMILEEDQDQGLLWPSRVFLQGVKLDVTDHRSSQTLTPGQDLLLDLRTPHSDRVDFRSRNSSDWSVLWVRGDSDSQRLEKHPSRERLILKNLLQSDQGTYRVLDKHGLPVSNVDLSVKGGAVVAVAAAAVTTGRGSQSSLLVLVAMAMSFLVPALLWDGRT